MRVRVGVRENLEKDRVICEGLGRVRFICEGFVKVSACNSCSSCVERELTPTHGCEDRQIEAADRGVTWSRARIQQPLEKAMCKGRE